MVVEGVQTVWRNVATAFAAADITELANNSGLTELGPCCRHAKTTSAGAVPWTPVTAAGEKRPLSEH